MANEVKKSFDSLSPPRTFFYTELQEKKKKKLSWVVPCFGGGVGKHGFKDKKGGEGDMILREWENGWVFFLPSHPLDEFKKTFE